MTMPRGSRKKSIEDQIAEVDSKINELQEQKKQLLAEKEQEDIRHCLTLLRKQE
jgi:TolA-binding protein